MSHHRLLILGSGPAGLTAAIYAARANLKPTLITGLNEGGQLLIADQVDNWPGEENGIAGPALMQKMLAQAKRFEVNIINDHIESVDLSKHPFTLQGNEKYSCDALIIATGATAKKLGLPTEKQFLGKGVSYCATCDGFFYRNKKVVVIGGGNTALDEALYLAKVVNEVTIIHRRDRFRAEPILIDKVLAATKENKIKLLYNHTCAEILGDASGVTGLKLQSVLSKETKELKTDGVFIAIGHAPNSEMFRDKLNMQNDYILINNGLGENRSVTSIPGVFAAGDVTDQIYRQAVVAAGSGCMAALDAKKYLENQ